MDISDFSIDIGVADGINPYDDLKENDYELTKEQLINLLFNEHATRDHLYEDIDEETKAVLKTVSLNNITCKIFFGIKFLS